MTIRIVRPEMACWLLVISGLAEVDDSASAFSWRTRSAATISRGLPSNSMAKSAGPRPATIAPAPSTTVASTTTTSTPVRKRGGAWASTAIPDKRTMAPAAIHPRPETFTRTRAPSAARCRRHLGQPGIDQRQRVALERGVRLAQAAHRLEIAGIVPHRRLAARRVVERGERQQQRRLIGLLELRDQIEAFLRPAVGEGDLRLQAHEGVVVRPALPGLGQQRRRRCRLVGAQPRFDGQPLQVGRGPLAYQRHLPRPGGLLILGPGGVAG